MAEKDSDKSKSERDFFIGTPKAEPGAASEIPRKPKRPTTKPKSDNN